MGTPPGGDQIGSTVVATAPRPVPDRSPTAIADLLRWIYRISGDFGCYGQHVPTYRISEVATLLGVSDDTVRRWADSGKLPTVKESGSRLVVDGRALADFAVTAAADIAHVADGPIVAESARNRFPGIVTKVVRDGVMAQVEILAGTFRVVSLMSREAADELGLEPGVLAVAAIKSTNVVVEVPKR
jgi:molybdopterin-binding protein